MLFVDSRISDYDLDGAARLALLEKLQENGLVPLIRSTRLHCYELALLAPERVRELDRFMAAWGESEGDAPYVSGDVFCFEDFVLFLIFGEGAKESSGDLRAGIVYRDDTHEPRQKLESFCRNVREALNAARTSGGAGNGAGTGNGQPSESRPKASGEWRKVEGRAAQGFARFTNGREAEGAEAVARNGGSGAHGQSNGGDGSAASTHARGEKASATGGKVLTEAERERVVSLLEDGETRRLLRRLIEAQSDGRTSELLSGARGGAATTETLLGSLAAAGLVRREVLVSCRKQGRSLFRLPSMDAFEMVTSTGATCSECGSTLADERVEEMVKPTELAATLLRDGSWMASRLRTLLREELGIAETDLAVRPSADDGEVHMMANVSGETFLFYLRDGDVSASHARRALDLENETGAAHLVVIATAKVQDEARVRLREHARRRARTGVDVEVMLLEGIDAAAAELRHAFERVALRTVAAELYPLDASLGLSVGHMIAARFRLTHKSGALRDLATAAASNLTGNLREF